MIGNVVIIVHVPKKCSTNGMTSSRHYYRHTERSNQRLQESLGLNDIWLPLCVLASQQRHSIVFGSEFQFHFITVLCWKFEQSIYSWIWIRNLIEKHVDCRYFYFQSWSSVLQTRNGTSSWQLDYMISVRTPLFCFSSMFLLFVYSFLLF